MRGLQLWALTSALLACACGGGDGGPGAEEAVPPAQITLKCRHTDQTKTLECPAGAACPPDGTEVYCPDLVEVLDGVDAKTRINNWESDGVWDRVKGRTALLRAPYLAKEGEGGGFETDVTVFGAVIHVRPLPAAFAPGEIFVGRATIAEYDEGIFYDDLVLTGASPLALEAFERDAALEALDGLIEAWSATPQDPTALQRLREAAALLGDGPDVAAVFLLRGTSRDAVPDSVQLGTAAAAAGTSARNYPCLWSNAKTEVACGPDEACLPEGTPWVCPGRYQRPV